MLASKPHRRSWLPEPMLSDVVKVMEALVMALWLAVGVNRTSRPDSTISGNPQSTHWPPNDLVQFPSRSRFLENQHL